ncbi:hypothetical protein Tco_0099484 [Tanacetum coccineum]
MAGLQYNKFRGDKGKIILEKAMLAEAQEDEQILDEEQLTFLADTGIPASQAQTVIPHNAAFQIKDLDTYDSDCDDLSTAQAVLMANISNYGFDIFSEDFEHSPVMDFTNDKISSESNIIPYFQYLEETQQATIQDTNLKAQQDSMILSTVHMLTKPQAFYDNTHKQALGYQNPFYLKKAQRIKPTLYDGVVISNTYAAMHVIDDEETLILEEESRTKMFEKAKDPEVIAKKISHKPIDYA